MKLVINEYFNKEALKQRAKRFAKQTWAGIIGFIHSLCL